MGYTVNGEGTLTVNHEREAEACASIRLWAQALGHASFADDARLAKVTTMQDAWSALGFEVAEQEPGVSFWISNYDSWGSDWNDAARILAPGIAKGEAEWTGQMDEHWRWRFVDGELIEEEGTIAYGGPGLAILLSDSEVALLEANRMNDHPGWESIGRKIDTAREAR